MSDQLVSISEIARTHGKRRQTIHKLVKRLSIRTVKVRGKNTRGQVSSHISLENYEELQRHLGGLGTSPGDEVKDGPSDVVGVLYLIQLEPDSDPGRFKLGHTTNIDERMRSHRTVAPFVSLKRKWPCRLIWEKTAIECVTQDCERLYTEVFRTDDIDGVIERADQFFQLMPTIEL